VLFFPLKHSHRVYFLDGMSSLESFIGLLVLFFVFCFCAVFFFFFVWFWFFSFFSPLNPQRNQCVAEKSLFESDGELRVSRQNDFPSRSEKKRSVSLLEVIYLPPSFPDAPSQILNYSWRFLKTRFIISAPLGGVYFDPAMGTFCDRLFVFLSTGPTFNFILVSDPWYEGCFGPAYEVSSS